MSGLPKKINVECFIHITLLVLIIINGRRANILVSYYGFVLPLFGLFFMHTFILVPRFFVEKQYLKYILYLSLTFAGCFAISLLCSSIGQSIFEHGETSPLEALINYPSIRRESLLSLIFVLIFSGIYAFIRQLVMDRRFQLLKRIAFFSSLTILGVALIFGIKYYFDVNWKGHNTIHFIENQAYQSLEEMIKQPQFENKAVYVDLWFTSCSPCIQEFQHLPEVKEKLKGKSVEYLYLARETSMPHDRQRWKNMIRKFNLNGWHLYMSPQFASQVWERIEKNTAIKSRYPHYLLIDRQGRVVSYNAYRPQDKEKIVSEIEALLD